MNIFVFNAMWMGWNTILALFGIFLSWRILKSSTRFEKALYFLLWLVFVPNTLYILTDAQHILHQWQDVAGGFTKAFLLSQYAVFLPLGAVTFFISVYFFERGFARTFAKVKGRYALASRVTFSHLIVLLNFLIAFGVVMGRTQRTNSWEVVTNTYGVIEDMLRILNSSHLVFTTILTGVAANMLYFTIRKLLTDARSN